MAAWSNDAVHLAKPCERWLGVKVRPDRNREDRVERLVLYECQRRLGRTAVKRDPG
jgi:hypothetical protein